MTATTSCHDGFGKKLSSIQLHQLAAELWSFFHTAKRTTRWQRSSLNVCHMAGYRGKSGDDIVALMHVVYLGEDAVPLQNETEL